MNYTIATQVRNFYFDNETSEKIFSNPSNSYMANEKLQGEEQFHFKNYLLEMPRLKSATQKVNFVMAKALPKRLHTKL